MCGRAKKSRKKWEVCRKRNDEQFHGCQYVHIIFINPDVVGWRGRFAFHASCHDSLAYLLSSLLAKPRRKCWISCDFWWSAVSWAGHCRQICHLNRRLEASTLCTTTTMMWWIAIVMTFCSDERSKKAWKRGKKKRKCTDLIENFYLTCLVCLMFLISYFNY